MLMLQDDNQDQTTVDLARVMFDTAVLRSGYDLKVCQHLYEYGMISCAVQAFRNVHTCYQWTLSDTEQLQ